MVAAGIIFPLVAHLEGKKPEHWPFIALLGGFVALAYHDIVKALLERVSQLESKNIDRT